MSNIVDFVRTEVPENYIQNYPRFVLFLEKYYEWMSRRSGFTEEETRIIENDAGFIVSDLAKYIIDNRHKFSGIKEDWAKDYSLIEESNIKLPEAALDRMVSNYNVDRNFDFIESNDGYVIETADSEQLDAPYLDPQILQDWFDKLGFHYEVGARDTTVNDDILLIRLVKHIHSIKGTMHAMKLFFNIYFGEDIEIYLPKYEIAALDYNFVLDGNNTLRDDYYYNEFTYVIRTKRDPALYKELFESVYLKYFHPSGFKVFLEQQTQEG
ncbi:hypothetical protein [Ralstonia phage RSP15]|uniref:head closure Hc2 n=1 Tax=Ralstonia phage RSP15 TaxID=1785960 RepID=UPI00074D2EBF|nr:head closure Hc2 [Ralstonia phage RSP15]BAU40008.1 hypothetical protein [Ralstonia phage RSP15]